ncbi:MAG: SRPBCC domain-containing protein [Cyanobacteria bacterium SZAS LIN-2]|nr:SRPBCC domain-containing protein [Cyanobacteria bacterium SZAS LIN-2]
MTSTKAGPLATVRLRRTIKAPIERVFKAWTEPALMSKWFGCEQVTAVNVHNDFKVGGSYLIQMITGEVTMNVTGTYETIMVNKKLAFTWTSEFGEFATTDSLVEVQFIDKGDSTEVVLDHTRFASDHAAQGHNEGWTFALGNLERLLQGTP